MASRRDAIKAAVTAGTAGLAGCASLMKSDDSNKNQINQEGQQYERVGPFELVTVSRDYSPGWVDSVNLAAQKWKDLGIELEVKEKPLSSWVDYQLKHDYKVVSMGWGGRPERLDPTIFLHDLYHSEFAKEGGQNFAHFKNDEFDELADEVAETLDRQKRKEAAYEAQQIWSEEVPSLVLYYLNSLEARRTDRFSNWTKLVGGNPYTNAWNLASIEPKGDQSELIWATTEKVNTLNPMKFYSVAAQRQVRMLYDQLLKVGPDGQPRAWAAKDWNAIDQTTVEVTLREGMKWHDGEPVRPEDVKFTIDYLKEWDQPYLKPYYDVIESVELKDGNKIRFSLKSPSGSFITVNLTQIPLLPEHVWSGVVEENGLDHPKQWSDPDLTASGVVKVAEANLPGKITYEMHEDHFKDFNIDQFIVKKFGGKSAALGQVEKGAADYVERITPTQYDRVKGTEKVKTVTQPSFGWRSFDMMCDEKPFDDRTLRRAVNHAVDQEELVQTVWKDYGAQVGKATPIATANEFWHNPDVEQYDGGMSKAKQLLKEAGYAWADDGTLLRPVESSEQTESDN